MLAEPSKRPVRLPVTLPLFLRTTVKREDQGYQVPSIVFSNQALFPAVVRDINRLLSLFGDNRS